MDDETATTCNTIFTNIQEKSCVTAHTHRAQYMENQSECKAHNSKRLHNAAKKQEHRLHHTSNRDKAGNIRQTGWVAETALAANHVMNTATAAAARLRRRYQQGLSGAVSGPRTVFHHKQLHRRFVLTSITLLPVQYLNATNPHKALELWELWKAKPDLPGH